MENFYTNPQSFYKNYLKEYHQVRALYLDFLLKNEEVLKQTIAQFENSFQITDNIGLIIQADLRQNYFHAIETFFELFFALLPKNDLVPDNATIYKKLVKANWRKNYKSIQDISKGSFKIDSLLKKKIKFNGYDVPIFQYLFYLGIFDREKFSKEIFEDIDNSLNAICKGIGILAKDFSNREEYNAYKHALRIFPAFKSFHILDAKNMEKKIGWDLSNSVSFFQFDEKNKKYSAETKILDSERNINMTLFCSNLIQNMIYYRHVVFMNKTHRKDKILIRTFDINSVNECGKHYVNIQDLKISSQEILDDASVVNKAKLK